MAFIRDTGPGGAFDISRSVAALVFPIFGGLYTTIGPVIGTLLLRSLEEYLRVTPPWKDGYQVAYGLVIVVAVLFMPRGLVGLVRDRLPRTMWRFSRQAASPPDSTGSPRRMGGVSRSPKPDPPPSS